MPWMTACFMRDDRARKGVQFFGEIIPRWSRIWYNNPGMATVERELQKMEPVIERLCRFSLLGKKVEVTGEKNFVRTGPNIIVGNHIGSFKDIATIFRIVPRPVFFTANRMIFNREEFNDLIKRHLMRHLKTFGYFLDLVVNPIKAKLVHFISTNVHKVGTIPVDLTGHKRLAIRKCEEYLEKGRAIIALQGRGRIMDNDPNPYVSRFRRGPSVLSYKLYERQSIAVAVTPMAMFGTQAPLLFPGKIRVNVGEPMYISDYLAGNVQATIERFRSAMERRVHALLMDLLRAR